MRDKRGEYALHDESLNVTFEKKMFMFLIIRWMLVFFSWESVRAPSTFGCRLLELCGSFSSCAVILAWGNILFSSSSLHFLIQVRNSGLKLPDTRFLSFSCSKVFSRLFRFTILERFLVIVFCSLSLFYPLTFWLRISPVLFSFPLSLKLLFAFHPLSHCARHLAPCGKTDFSIFCPNMVHMTLASNSYFWVCLVLVKK